MKRAARIYKWIIISFLMQILILLFINNMYLTDKGNLKEKIKVNIIDQIGKIDLPEPAISVKIPEKASQVKVSFDNSFASYLLDGKLEIVNVHENKTIKTIKPDKDSITFYRWLPDRNMVIYGLKPNENEPVRVQVVTYNVDTEVEHIYPKISSNISKGSEITDIVLSQLTKVVYVKVKVNDTQARIYRYNIMDELSFVMSTDVRTVIKEPVYTDFLVYQDEKNKLYVRDGLKSSTVPLQFQDSKMMLLAIDGEDRVYAGELDESGKIVKIRYAKIPLENGKQWEEIAIKRPAAPENIVVTSDGKLYEIAEKEGVLYRLGNGNEKKSYSGKFIDISDNQVVTREQDKLKIIPLK